MDILGYLYYKALILIALKRYQEAIEALKLVISYPTQITHKVHIEAYKKLILVSLIESGYFPSLPKYTAQMLRYKLELPGTLQCYKLLSHAYSAKDDKEFQTIIDSNF